MANPNSDDFNAIAHDMAFEQMMEEADNWLDVQKLGTDAAPPKKAASFDYSQQNLN